jgi:hypothetical protein
MASMSDSMSPSGVSVFDKIPTRILDLWGRTIRSGNAVRQGRNAFPQVVRPGGLEPPAF